MAPAQQGQHMTQPRILLLGVGNILYSDEGVGVYAAQYLENHYTFSENVTVMDGGVMGKLLMPPILECDRLIVIDAVLGDHEPGTMYRLEDEGLRKSLGFRDSQHEVDLVDVLISCDMVGHRPDAVVIGMEPADYTTMQLGLSPVCQEKLPAFVEHVLKELREQGGEAWLKEE
jgi:hydrogenase maturation protease